MYSLLFVKKFFMYSLFIFLNKILKKISTNIFEKIFYLLLKKNFKNYSKCFLRVLFLSLIFLSFILYFFFSFLSFIINQTKKK